MDSPMLEVEVVLGEAELKRSFKKMEQEAKKSGKKSGDKFGRQFDKESKEIISSSSIFKGAFFADMASRAIMSAAHSTKRIASEVISSAAGFETYQTQFSTLLQSAEAAKQHIKDLAEFSARTPFQLPGIADTSKMLLSFGFQQDQIVKKLQEMGDVAAISGSPLKDLALIYGQVSAAGKLTGERFLQLQERAVPIAKELAKELGVAESEIKDLISKGAVSFEVFEKAFSRLTKKGGLFYKGMEKQSADFTGKVSTLTDNIGLLYGALGDSALDTLKAFTDQLISRVQDATKYVREHSDEIKKYVSGTLEGLKSGLVTIGPIIADTFKFFAKYGDIILVAAATYKVTQGLIAARAAMLAFNVATAANPLMIIALGAAAAYAAIKKLQSVAKEGWSTEKQLERSKERVKQINASINAEQNLIDANEKLSEKQKIHHDKNIAQLRAELSHHQAIVEAAQKKIELEAQAVANKSDEDEIENEQGNELGPVIPVDILAERAEAVKGIMFHMKKDFRANMASMAMTSKKFAATVTKSLHSGLSQGAGSAFASFGKAIAEGENGLKAMAASFIGTLGQMSVQMGTMFMAQAAAMFFSPNAADNAKAPGLLVTGAALATLGGAMQALSGGMGTSTTGGSSPAPTSYSAPADLNESPSSMELEEEKQPSFHVEVNVQGDIIADDDEKIVRIGERIRELVRQDGMAFA